MLRESLAVNCKPTCPTSILFAISGSRPNGAMDQPPTKINSVCGKAAIKESPCWDRGLHNVRLARNAARVRRVLRCQVCNASRCSHDKARGDESAGKPHCMPRSQGMASSWDRKVAERGNLCGATCSSPARSSGSFSSNARDLPRRSPACRQGTELCRRADRRIREGRPGRSSSKIECVPQIASEQTGSLALILSRASQGRT